MMSRLHGFTKPSFFFASLFSQTTVFGMTGCAPDFVMLMIGSNAGIVGMTKEHLGLSLALGVPVLVVITKIDMCPTNVLENTVKQLTKILKSAGCRKIPMFVKVRTHRRTESLVKLHGVVNDPKRFRG